VLGALLIAPIAALTGFGMYYLWLTGLAFWLWWPLTGCFVLAVFLGWRWQGHKRLLTNEFEAPLHWTERDRQAWRLVEERAKEVPKLRSEQMTSPQFFLESAQTMAHELARF